MIGDRWTLLIIRDAFLGLSRFEQFQNHWELPGMYLQSV